MSTYDEDKHEKNDTSRALNHREGIAGQCLDQSNGLNANIEWFECKHMAQGDSWKRDPNSNTATLETPSACTRSGNGLKFVNVYISMRHQKYHLFRQKLGQSPDRCICNNCMLCLDDVTPPQLHPSSLPVFN